MPGVLEELERATVEVAERIGPAVVGIGHGWGQGSGVVVAEGVVDPARAAVFEQDGVIRAE